MMKAEKTILIQKALISKETEKARHCSVAKAKRQKTTKRVRLRNSKDVFTSFFKFKNQNYKIDTATSIRTQTHDTNVEVMIYED